MEQRRHSRKPLVVKLTYALRETREPRAPREAGDAEEVNAISKDLSLGGMFVETPTPPPFGATVTLVFSLPGDERPLRLNAVVRWVRPDGMGVQFDTMGARETHAITEATR